jgi:large subunit ribosomal protein L1
MPKKSVRYQAQFAKSGDRDRRMPVGEAVKLLKEMGEIKPKKSYKRGKGSQGLRSDGGGGAAFGDRPKQADQMIRGAVSLPKGIGKRRKVVAFCPKTMVESPRRPVRRSRRG